MLGYGRTALPVTGGGVVIGGLALGQGVLVAIGVALVAAGAAAVRFGFRRGRNVGDA